MIRSVLFVLGCAGAAESAFCQCGSTQVTTLLDAYTSLRQPVDGAVQSAGSAWSFRVGAVDGPLMTGGAVAGYPAWVTPGQPFLVPCVGPVFSPLLRQYADRVPSISGVQAHPGYAGLDNYVVFTPQRAVTLTDLRIPAEVLGDISDGVLISAGVIRGSGATVSLMAPTLVSYTVTGSSLLVAPSVNFPLSLLAGERLWIRVSMNGNPFEDWANINPTITLSGGPVVIAPPLDSSVCPSSTAQLSVTAAGSGPLTYRWRIETTPGVFVPVTNGAAAGGGVISGASSAALSISPAGGPDSGRYDCLVTDSCGTPIVAGPVFLDVPACNSCPADFDGSGGTPDAEDINGFFFAWLAGDGCADVDCSGGTPDAGDIDRFFVLWLSGGC